MVNKKLMINGEKAVLADIKSAVSIAFFDEELSRFEGSIDEHVKRAVIYNKVVVENLIKRIFSAHMHIENNDEDIKQKQIQLRGMFYHDSEYKGYSKIYYADLEKELFSFVKDICDENKQVRSYSEYIIYSLINHYFDYIKN